MSDETLKPCPLCGGEASANGHQKFEHPPRSIWWPDGSPITESFFVNCIVCGLSTQGFSGIGQRTRAEAVERWNTRPDRADDGWPRAIRQVAWLAAAVSVLWMVRHDEFILALLAFVLLFLGW